MFTVLFVYLSSSDYGLVVLFLELTETSLLDFFR